jgi:acetyl esterase/lipase
VLRYLLTRPRGFTLKTFLIFRAIRLLSRLVPLLPPPETRRARWRTPRTLGPKPAVKLDTVAIEPVPEGWRTGYAADAGGVQPLQMPGFLLTPPSAGDRAILYLHGGGYYTGHPLYTSFPHRLAAETGARVLAAQYRKPLDAASAFPGPLLDALAAWRYLTTIVKPAHIVLVGDSAGGHLALCLVRQLGALNEPLPAGVALASPWADFSLSFPWDAPLDVITKPQLARAAASATRHYDDAERRGAFFSPALAEAGHWRFLGSRVFVTWGGREALADEDAALVAGMRRDGVDVAVWTVSASSGVEAAEWSEATVEGSRGSVRGCWERMESANADARTRTACTTRRCSTPSSRRRRAPSRTLGTACSTSCPCPTRRRAKRASAAPVRAAWAGAA